MADLVSPEILSAISRLNEHARAYGFGKRAIYAYKTFVAAAYATEARPIQIGAKCHHCSGTGTYRDWDGYDRGRCYRCTRGITTLLFIESAIGDYRWHHPISSGGYEVLRSVWGIVETKYSDAGGEIAVLRDGTERNVEYGSPGTWGPNLPGAEKLPSSEACELLNVVEQWIPSASFDRRGADWPHRRAIAEINQYRLDLDRMDEAACGVCGATEDLASVRMGGSSGYIRYARRACASCHNALRWPTHPNPASLTSSVMAWLAHPTRRAPPNHWVLNDGLPCASEPIGLA